MRIKVNKEACIRALKKDVESWTIAVQHAEQDEAEERARYDRRKAEYDAMSPWQKFRGSVGGPSFFAVLSASGLASQSKGSLSTAILRLRAAESTPGDTIDIDFESNPSLVRACLKEQGVDLS
jgi:hypothetical protein